MVKGKQFLTLFCGITTIHDMTILQSTKKALQKYNDNETRGLDLHPILSFSVMKRN